MGHHTSFTDFAIPFVRTGEPLPAGFVPFFPETPPASSCGAVGQHLAAPAGDLLGIIEQSSPPEPPPSRLCETPAAGTGDDGGRAIDRASPAIVSILDLRAMHHARGHTPETDQERGSAFFTGLMQDFLQGAVTTRNPQRRRARLVSAAAMLVALIDKEDFAAARAALEGDTHAPA